MKLTFIWTILFLIPYMLFSQQYGILDSSFNSDGLLIDSPTNIEDRAFDIAVQPDGKIVIAGSSYTPNDRLSLVSRYLPDGSTDSSFGNNGHLILNLQAGLDDYFNSIAIQTDGKILLSGPAGNGTTFSTNVVRLLSDGTLDTNFGLNGIASFYSSSGKLYPYSTVIDSSGRIIIAGNEMSNMFILRLLSDGTTDNTFDGDGMASPIIPGTFALAMGMTLDNVGRIITVGYATLPFRYMAARFDTTGTLDSTFGLGGLFLFPMTGFGQLNDCKVQTDGKIVTCGSFDASGGGSNHDFVLMRINENGTLDSSFATNGIFELAVSTQRDILQSIIIQPDGKNLAAGYAQSTITTGNFALLRLDSSGITDNTFGVNGLILTDFSNSADIGSNVILQPDLKILLCGWTLQQNIWNVAIARYHSGLFTNTDEISINKSQPHIFPNPANGQIQLEWKQMCNRIAPISIFDIHGKKLRTYYSSKGNLEQNTLSIDISDFSAGVYFIKFDDDKIQTLKFIKTK